MLHLLVKFLPSENNEVQSMKPKWPLACLCFCLSRVHRIVHKQGKDDSLAHVRKLVNVLEQPGPVSLSKVEELVDLDSFITFWAAEVLIGCFDG